MSTNQQKYPECGNKCGPVCSSGVYIVMGCVPCEDKDAINAVAELLSTRSMYHRTGVSCCYNETPCEIMLSNK